MKQLIILILLVLFIRLDCYSNFTFPERLLPVPNQNRMRIDVIEFFWSTADSAESYILELSDNYYFTTKPIIHEATKDTFLLKDVILDSCKTYFWRVSAIRGKDTAKPVRGSILSTICPSIHTPELYYPLNDTVKGSTVKLLWETQKYSQDDYMIASDSLFDLVYATGYTRNGYATYNTAVMDGRKYFWRVRGKNTDTVTEWSPVQSFQFDIWKGPEIDYPIDNDSNTSVDLIVRWHPIDSVKYYELTLIDNDDPKVSKYNRTIIGESLAIIPGKLNYERNFSIELDAHLSTGATAPTKIRFRTKTPPVPFTKSIQLIYPDSLQTVTTPKISFIWHSDHNASSYELWLSDSSAIENVSFLRLNVDEHNDTVYTMKDCVLSPDKDYYWRVRGINISGKGKWSEVRKFHTSGFSDVSDFDRQTSFSITPNPATDFIEIQNPENGAIEILNVFGQIQTTTSLRDTPPYQEGENVKLDVSGLAPGVYFVRINNKVTKFVKI